MNRFLLIGIAATLCAGVIVNAQTAAPTKPAAAEAKSPAGVDPKLTSTDADYGYTEKSPIKVGAKDKFGGPAAERAYLNTLRDEAGKPVKFERQGSVGAGPDGNVLDAYEVQTSTGRTLTLLTEVFTVGNAR